MKGQIFPCWRCCRFFKRTSEYHFNYKTNFQSLGDCAIHDLKLAIGWKYGNWNLSPFLTLLTLNGAPVTNH